MLLLLIVNYTTQAQTTYTITTLAGNGTAGYSGDSGVATSAELNTPVTVALDTAGNIYFSDSHNNVIRKISKNGIITTIAGNGTAGFSGDYGPATSAGLYYPAQIALDAKGNIYFAEYDNRIRKITASTGNISTIAGTGTMGFSGDGGLAISAKFSNPYGLAIDVSGNMFIGDQGNNRIRAISPTSGNITTIAGNGTGSYSGDGGPATSAELYYPAGIAVDAYDDIYIADQANNRIRKVSGGEITTIAGIGTSGFSGDGGSAISAEITNAQGVAIDILGNIYIADGGNNRIRKISGGIITTIAGNGTAGFSGDGGPATSAEIYLPYGITVDTAGNIYFADVKNNRIRKLTPNNVTGVTAAQNATPVATAYPNPATDKLTISSSATGFDFTVYDAVGSNVYSASAEGTEYSLPVTTFKKGIYLIVVKAGTNSATTKVVIE